MNAAARILAIGSVGAILVGGIAITPATAAPVVNGEFAVSSVGTNNQITAGPDGNIWLTLDGANDLAKITPAGVVTEYNDALTTPTGITAGPDGNLWLTVSGGVAKVSPANPTVAAFTAIAAITDPRAITVGPDGNLWTASNNNVIKIPPANPGAATTYAPTGLTASRWIASGNGQLWVADFAGAQILAVNPNGTAGTGYATGGGPQGVAFGGGIAGYSNPGAAPQTIGRITPAGTPQTTNAPMTDPFGGAYGVDGAFWFAQFAGNNVGRLTRSGSYSTVSGLSAASGPRQITAGPANTLWVTLDNAEKVARVSGLQPLTPNTTITKKPKKVVKTRKAKAKVTLGFVADQPGSSFVCQLKKAGKKKASSQPCNSPTSYRLKAGGYTFRVRAVLAGVSDPTPATYSFTVARR
ncbi:MAG: hypothetical protein WCI74_03165 [Actinomycetes bacterium]